MDAAALLSAVMFELPGVRAHLRMSDDGARLIVGLVSQPDRKFYDAALDDADMKRDPKDIAREIAGMFRHAMQSPSPGQLTS